MSQILVKNPNIKITDIRANDLGLILKLNSTVNLLGLSSKIYYYDVINNKLNLLYCNDQNNTTTDFISDQPCFKNHYYLLKNLPGRDGLLHLLKINIRSLNSGENESQIKCMDLNNNHKERLIMYFNTKIGGNSNVLLAVLNQEKNLLALFCQDNMNDHIDNPTKLFSIKIYNLKTKKIFKTIVLDGDY
jgi:hypothetical protein